MTKILISAIVLLTALLGYALWGKSRATNKAEEAQSSLKVEQSYSKSLSDTLAKERDKAASQAQIETTYEQDKTDADSKGKAATAGLDDGTLQLQKRWAGCETQRLSDAAASAAKSDGGTDDRAESAGRIIAAAAAADAQIRGLQAVVTEDRK